MAEDKKILFKVTQVKQYFPLKKHLGKPQLYVKANDGLTFDIYEGETFGLVGESGCGKSTLGRVLLQLYHQTAGKSMYYGRTLSELAPEYVRKLLEKAEKYRDRAKQLKSAYEAEEAGYNQLSEEEQMKIYDQLTAKRNEYEIAWLNVVQVLGGFAAIEDLTEIKQAMLAEWRLNSKIGALSRRQDGHTIRANACRNRYEQAKKSGKEKNALLRKEKNFHEKVNSCIRAIDELRQQQQEAMNQITKLRKKYYDNAEFAKLEELRDDGIDLARLTYHEMRYLRKDMQLIFQDPYSSLNPRMTLGQIIGEGLRTHNFFTESDPAYQEYILKTMADCGLAPYFLHRYPHQFSGGQRQRIGIARSLALQPKFVVCDEAVSALDVSIQSQIINLLREMKEKANYTYLFITHDLSVVKYISDRIGVMYLGSLVELASSEDLFRTPKHPYTEALLSAIPTIDPDAKKETLLLEGDIPSPIAPPPGCKFHTRCRYCTEICRVQMPVWEEVAPNHYVACHHKLESRS